MATKKVKVEDTSTIDILKNKTRNFNKVVLKNADQIVDETLATGEEWQGVFAKALKKGTVLFGKQQDMALDGLEMLKGQYGYSAKRLRKLLSLGKPTAKKKVAPKRKATNGKTKKGIDAVMAATIKAEKKVAPKVAPKAKTRPSSTTAKSTKLTLIEGIGPKIQQLLNAAGIKNLGQLAIAKPAELKKVLAAAGSRYQMHDPSSWPAQAKLAAAGKTAELKTLQAELKGGK